MAVYWVYIITNSRSDTVLYIGITNNLVRRIEEHRNKIVEGFSKKYYLQNLIYFEQYSDINQALEREKQLKRWHRQWKLNLIKKSNPKFEDLSKRL